MTAAAITCVALGAFVLGTLFGCWLTRPKSPAQRNRREVTVSFTVDSTKAEKQLKAITKKVQALGAEAARAGVALEPLEQSQE